MPISLAATSSGSMHGAIIPIQYYLTPLNSGIQFGGIPTNLAQDIYVVAQMQNNSSGSGINIYCNGDTNSGNYSYTALQGNGSSATSFRGTNLNYVNFSNVTSTSSQTTGLVSTHEFHILNANNTSTYKTILWRWANDLNGSGTSGLVAITYRNTAAISSFTITPSSGQWNAGTTMAMYGIRTVGQ